VNCSRTLKWFIILLLPLTLGWKLTVHLDDPSELNDTLVEFFARHDFDVTVTEEYMDYLHQSPVVQAVAGGCRVRAGKISTDGENWALPRRLAKPTDRVFVVFQGRVYPAPPSSLSAVNGLWSRFLREMGLVRHQTSLFAVMASASCHAENLPWQELGDGGVL
jgi:hypothetical protein